MRRIEARDESRWRELFDGYTRFYERDPSTQLTDYVWTCLMDAGSPVFAIVAEHEAEGVIGMANYVIHASTLARAPTCYLQDLFVDPSHRAQGAGKLLIDWLLGEMAVQGWSRVYWHTKENNYRARGLYDKYTPHSGFVRYVITNPTLTVC